MDRLRNTDFTCIFLILITLANSSEKKTALRVTYIWLKSDEGSTPVPWQQAGSATPENLQVSYRYTTALHKQQRALPPVSGHI
jgi:hypothetical protein